MSQIINFILSLNIVNVSNFIVINKLYFKQITKKNENVNLKHALFKKTKKRAKFLPLT